MPTIQENLKAWDYYYKWPMDGEPWSTPWGTSTAQWEHTLLPRIQKFLPAGTILEIAPGRGRWTRFLKDMCDHLIIVDLSPKCIEACKKRFSTDTNISYYTNDGSSLEMIADNSVDFVFSFDSLVHVEAVVMKSYIEQIARKLKTGGGGFIHHSNLGNYPILGWAAKLSRVARIYNYLSFIRNQEHWRAYSMTARRFQAYCEQVGLACEKQELINWRGTRGLIDCMSTFVRSESSSPRSCEVVRNSDFMQEAECARRNAGPYEAE